MQSTNCPFCSFRDRGQYFLGADHAFAMFDNFPVVENHILIISWRHVESFFDLTAEEQDEFLGFCRILGPQYQDLNIGMNIGKAAGQTVPHAHLHMIPRKKGDVENPSGGIRQLFPDKAVYES